MDLNKPTSTVRVLGIFDIFKKARSPQDRPAEPISNEAYLQKRNNEIEVLESQYDLTSAGGISAIPVPTQKEVPKESLPSVTSRIEYYLLIKAGTYAREGKEDLALACYRKANELMPVSSVEYGREPYMRLPRFLRRLRRFDEARIEEAKIEALFHSGAVVDYGGDSPDVAAKRREYDWLWEHTPDICPKSLAAYSKMKNANSEKYQLLVKAAHEHGFKIE